VRTQSERETMTSAFDAATTTEIRALEGQRRLLDWE
jgi:hypothetical protein